MHERGCSAADGVSSMSMGSRSSFSRPVAIVILPLVGLFFERDLDEPITGAFGPALYALYVAGVISFGALAIGSERLSAAVASLAAGTLLSGAVIVALVAVVGTAAACLVLLFSFPFSGPSRTSYDRLTVFAGGAMLAAVLLSPWLTSRALWELSTSSLRASVGRIGKELTALCTIAGVGLAIGLATLATKADAAWLAPRLGVFDRDDVGSWEKALSEIKGRWLCGHRRCLMKVCTKLDARFGRTGGESGFASPLALVLEAPDVPKRLVLPFEKVYGYRFRQVCVIGD
jgi:hypothetical protein